MTVTNREIRVSRQRFTLAEVFALRRDGVRIVQNKELPFTSVLAGASRTDTIVIHEAPGKAFGSEVQAGGLGFVTPRKIREETDKARTDIAIVLNGRSWKLVGDLVMVVNNFSVVTEFSRTSGFYLTDRRNAITSGELLRASPFTVYVSRVEGEAAIASAVRGYSSNKRSLLLDNGPRDALRVVSRGAMSSEPDGGIRIRHSKEDDGQRIAERVRRIIEGHQA